MSTFWKFHSNPFNIVKCMTKNRVVVTDSMYNFILTLLCTSCHTQAAYIFLKSKVKLCLIMMYFYNVLCLLCLSNAKAELTLVCMSLSGSLWVCLVYVYPLLAVCLTIRCLFPVSLMTVCCLPDCLHSVGCPYAVCLLSVWSLCCLPACSICCLSDS